MQAEPGSGSNPWRAPVTDVDLGDGSGARMRDAADPFGRPCFRLGQRALALGERDDVCDEDGRQLRTSHVISAPRLAAASAAAGPCSTALSSITA